MKKDYTETYMQLFKPEYHEFMRSHKAYPHIKLIEIPNTYLTPIFDSQQLSVINFKHRFADLDVRMTDVNLYTNMFCVQAQQPYECAFYKVSAEDDGLYVAKWGDVKVVNRGARFVWVAKNFGDAHDGEVARGLAKIFIHKDKEKTAKWLSVVSANHYFLCLKDLGFEESNIYHSVESADLLRSVRVSEASLVKRVALFSDNDDFAPDEIPF